MVADLSLSSDRSIALMGLLVEQPTYVHDLVRRYEDRFGDLIPIGGTSAFYRTVDALVAAGLLEESLSIDPSEPRRRVVYRATAAGARSYRGALVGGLKRDQMRETVVMRLLSAAATGGALAHVLAVLDVYERECLADATRLPPSTPDGQPCDLDALCKQLFAEQDRLLVGTRIEWINLARKRLRQMAAGAGDP